MRNYLIETITKINNKYSKEELNNYSSLLLIYLAIGGKINEK